MAPGLLALGAVFFLGTGLRSSHKKLYALDLKKLPEADCKLVLEEITDGKVDSTLPALLRRHCAASDAVQDKAKCAGVTRLTEEALAGSSAETPDAACKDLEKWLLTLARDLHGLNITTAGDPACVQAVQGMTGKDAMPAKNFTHAMAKGCEVSCKEVISVANHVLADVKPERELTPKLYCRMHEDWLSDVGVYDIDALFALVLGGAQAKKKDAVVSAGEFPKALEDTRGENEKIFEALAKKPTTPAASFAAVLGLLAVFQ